MIVLNALKAVRAKCLDCCSGNRAVVRYCSTLGCALWPYRFGMHPRTAMKKAYIGPDLLNPDMMPDAGVETKDREAAMAAIRAERGSNSAHRASTATNDEESSRRTVLALEG